MIIFNTFENIFTTNETNQNEETIEEDSRDLNSYSVFFDILDNIQQINNQSSINIHFFKNKDAFNNIVEVNATKQVIKNIDFEFKKGVFNLKLKNNDIDMENLTIHVYLNPKLISKLSKINNQSTGNLIFDIEDLELHNIEILNNNSGDITFYYLQADNVTVNNSGRGYIKGLYGRINKILNITLSNEAKLDFSYLLCDNVIADLTGSGNAKIICRQNLSGKITGKGDLKVYSFPKNIKITEANSGKLKIK